jgi:hypothetical protein
VRALIQFARGRGRKRVALPQIPLVASSVLLGIGLFACLLFAWSAEQFARDYYVRETAWLFAVCELQHKTDERGMVEGQVRYDGSRSRYMVDFYVVGPIFGSSGTMSMRQSSRPDRWTTLSGSIRPYGRGPIPRTFLCTVEVGFRRSMNLRLLLPGEP